jgi:hypothetical protein
MPETQTNPEAVVVEGLRSIEHLSNGMTRLYLANNQQIDIDPDHIGIEVRWTMEKRSFAMLFDIVAE